MNSEAMAFGAFCLVLGICLLVAAPTLASTVNSPFSSAYQSEVWELTVGGMLAAAIGAAVLAWGVGTKE